RSIQAISNAVTQLLSKDTPHVIIPNRTKNKKPINKNGNADNVFVLIVILLSFHTTVCGGIITRFSYYQFCVSKGRQINSNTQLKQLWELFNNCVHCKIGPHHYNNSSKDG